MSARHYIPPALREKTTNDPAQDVIVTSDKQGSGDSEDIVPRRLSDLRISDEHRKPLHTLVEIVEHYGGSGLQSTLHDSTQTPGKLAFIILFRNANPRWYPDRIIFAHTHIHILPGYSVFKRSLADEELAAEKNGFTKENEHDVNSNVKTEEKQNTSASTANDIEAVPQPSHDKTINTGVEPAAHPELLPIFMEVLARRGNPRKYVFHGYFRLMRVQFLKSNSPEVVRLLQQKWQPVQHNPNKPPPRVRERDSEAWKKSMDQEWAVIKLVKVKDDELEDVAEPDIKTIAEDDVQEPKGSGKDATASGNGLETSVHDEKHTGTDETQVVNED